jgi:hypothetical protein
VSTLIVSLTDEAVAAVLTAGQTAQASADGVAVIEGGRTVVFFPATVIRDPSIVTATVPDGVGRERLRWADGTLVVLDASPVTPAPVPQSVTPLQARKALRASGLSDAVEAYIATQSAALQDEWEYAISVERDNPAIAAAGPALGLTDAQIDDLFRLAATL